MRDQLTEAVGLLPKEFITLELAMAAAKEHAPELLGHLPASLLTEDVVNEVFAGRADEYYWKCNLSKIPEPYRTRDICLKALRCSMDNMPFVPAKLVDPEIVEKIVSSSGLLCNIGYIPSSLWSEEIAFKLLGQIGISRDSFYYSGSDNKKKAPYHTQIVLSFVPEAIKTHAFYRRFFDEKYAPEIIDLLTPRKFKDETYYEMMARLELKLVPASKLSYRIMQGAMSEGSRTSIREIMDNGPVKEYLMGIMDDTLADLLVTKDTRHFRSLPKKFQTVKRLILTVQTVAREDSDNFCKSYYPEHLLTLKVVKAFVKYGIKVEIPKKFWTDQFVHYCFEQGKNRSSGSNRCPKLSRPERSLPRRSGIPTTICNMR